jgi:cytochrome c biogenesis protein CcmG/thiol:disulfide interchange protein DsbE
VGKPMPVFSLPMVHTPEKTVSTKDFLGRPYLINVWASWCVACRQEHPLLMEMSRKGEVRLIGLNYKDRRGDAVNFLSSMGDPYEMSLSDLDGRIGIELGVYGVPETFLVDSKGVIKYKHIGPIDYADLNNKILPLMKELSSTTK